MVIGAGQAGLVTSFHLRRLGVDHVVLDGDRGSAAPGGAWRHRWPSLRLGRVHGLHELPGLSLAGSGVADDPDRPASEVVADYFAHYEQEFALPVRRPAHVTAVSRHGDGFRVALADGDVVDARGLVNATGTWTRPFRPWYPGVDVFAGLQRHVAEYTGPDEFAGRRVVVVGGGSSAVQLQLEIATVAASVTWVTRREPVWRTDEFSPEVGREAVALVEERVRAGLPPISVVGVTGLAVTDEVRAAWDAGLLRRRPMVAAFERDGVRWADGSSEPADAVLWATGFRAALDHLAPLHLRAPGGGIALDGTQVVGEPRLHLVGYGPSASTVGATRAGRAAAVALARALRVSAAA